MPRIIIEWARSTDADETITGYIVQIMNNQNEFVVHGDCDVTAALAMEKATPGLPKCAIPMSSFWAGEFQSDQGSYITLKVIAINDKGQSLASRMNVDGALVEKKPGMMNPPDGTRTPDTNDVVISWPVLTSPRNGGAEVITYIL